MTNINNNVRSFIPIGTNVSIAVNPAVSVVVPDDATGILFTLTAAGTFTLDGVTTPTSTVGFFTQFDIEPTFLHLYPGAPISFFSTAGILNYQFFRTNDTYSLTSRR